MKWRKKKYSIWWFWNLITFLSRLMFWPDNHILRFALLGIHYLQLFYSFFEFLTCFHILWCWDREYSVFEHVKFLIRYNFREIPIESVPIIVLLGSSANLCGFWDALIFEYSLLMIGWKYMRDFHTPNNHLPLFTVSSLHIQSSKLIWTTIRVQFLESLLPSKYCDTKNFDAM